jgi:hypothetical protein
LHQPRGQNSRRRPRSYTPAPPRGSAANDKDRRKSDGGINWWAFLPIALTAVEELTEPKEGWEKHVEDKTKGHKTGSQA